MNILVPNLGSTSLKYQLLEFPSRKTLAKGRLERIGRPDGDAPDYRTAVEGILAEAEKQPGGVDGVGFKAVHAGPRFRGSHLIDDEFLAALSEYHLAAPLHNGIYRTGIETFRELRPGLPLVAVLETGFHATIPAKAYTYGVPRAWEQTYGVRRYGFHGASHRFISERVPELIGKSAEDLRVVSCHLGGSASMCAIRGGESVEVTMGFSPQSGLENATRHGDLDPFAVLYVMEREGWTAAEMRANLLAGCGLEGVSGVAGGDMRDLQDAAGTGNERAALALDVFAHQVRKTIGAYAAALGGLDAIAFTGGIGENSAWVRAAACEGLGFAGVEIDSAANVAGEGDRRISRGEVEVWVVATNEELIVGRETARVLGG